MSTGSLIPNKAFESKCYLQVSLKTKDWCTYEGVCRINQVALHQDKLCDKCKYKREVDVPEILERLNNMEG